MPVPTLIHLTGHEHGSLNTGGVLGSRLNDSLAGSPTIVTSPVRSGLRALRINAAGAAQSLGKSFAAGTQLVVVSCAVLFQTALPSSGTNLQIIRLSAGAGVLRFNVASNQFGVFINGGTQTLLGPVLEADRWYQIDMLYDQSGTTWSLTAQVDGDATTEGNTTLAGNVATDISNIQLGTGSADTFDAVYDDLAVSGTSSDYPIGPVRIYSSIADGDLSHNITTSGDFDSFTTTQFDNTTTTGWTFIDHRPLQMANTAENVIRQELGSTSNYMEFSLEPLPVFGRIVDVRGIGVNVESATTGASLAEARLLDSTDTEVLTQASTSVINSTEDPGTTVQPRARLMTRPSGGWTPDYYNGLKFRLGFGDGAPDVNFIDFMLEVALQDLPPQVAMARVRT